MINRIINHYRIEEKLGEGGMGVVYRARDTKLDRTVALKFLPSHLLSDETEKRRFLLEARAASGLDHSNICSIHSIDESGDGTLFIVMAYYEGKSLKDKIGEKPLPLQEVIAYSIQIAAGLQEAHTKGVVHRDLKPANIFVTQAEQIKIIDFGLAKAAQRTMLTKSGTTLGTVPYMSPEQAQGGFVDHRTDIWSLGIVMYEMITGQRPFKSEYETALVYSILNEDPEPITGLRSGVPMDLERIIQKCLEKDPTDRYQSVNEVLTDLRRLNKKSSPGSQHADKSLKSAVQDKPGRSVSLTESKAKRRLIIPLVSGIIIIALIVILYLFFGITKEEFQLSSNRIVVMIFENLTGDPSLDPIGRMTSDWITQGLTQTGLVEIVPSTSLFAITRDMESDGLIHAGAGGIRYIARATGARLVISGTYYKIGEQIQFQAQITDVGTDRLLFVTDPITGLLSNPSESIELLRQRIMGTLAAQFDERISPYAESMRAPGSYEAYRYYMEGVERSSEYDYISAIPAFRRAIEADPDFIFSHIYLAVNYLDLNQLSLADEIVNDLKGRRDRLSNFDKANLDWLDGILRGDRSRALHAARTAASYAPGSEATWAWTRESLNSNRPLEALKAFETINPDIGIYKLWRDNYYRRLALVYHALEDYHKELEVVREGRRLFPDDRNHLENEIRVLAALRRVDEIEKLFDESLKLPSQRGRTPGETMLFAGIELRAHGYPEAAQNAFERAIKWYQERPGEFEYPHAIALYHALRWEESKKILEKLSTENPDNIHYRGYLGVIAARRGNRDEALKISEWLEKVERPYTFGSHTVWRARIAAQLGEQSHSMSLLREAFRQGTGYYGHWLHSDFDFDPLRDYRPFIEFIAPRY